MARSRTATKSPPPVVAPQPIPPADSFLDLRGAAQFLSLSASQVVRLHDTVGLPASDLSLRRNGGRAKRLLRFDPVRLRGWMHEREKAGRP